MDVLFKRCCNISNDLQTALHRRGSLIRTLLIVYWSPSSMHGFDMMLIIMYLS